MTTLKLKGLSCQNCAKHVEQALARVPGVERVKVSYPRAVAEIAGNAPLQELIKAVESAGYGAEPLGV